MASVFRVRPRLGRAFVLVAVLATVAISATPVSGAPGFKTSQQSMVTNLAAGGTVDPIITVGDTIGSYMFEAIPDGIGVSANGKGTVDVFVNHETSTVPFPYAVAPTPPTASNSFNDMTDSLVSKLKLHQGSAGVMSASYVITDAENFHRFCSSFIATKEHGFKKSMLLTNEEGMDWVNRTGMQWPATPGDAAAREIGLVVAHDINNGKTKPIYGMGRHNHENSLPLSIYGKPVVLSGDDTFTSNPAQSQVYSYIADDSDAVWNDTGTLYAFRADNHAVFNDYYDFPVNSPMSIPGELIPVPKNIATGLDTDGTDLVSSDVGYPPPPAGAWGNSAGTTTPIDGPQWVLEHWSDLNDAFQFVRIEDMAYDKRPGMANVVYLADSGRGATSAGGNPFTSSNGRIWKMVMDPADPTNVLSLSIFIEGDDAPVQTITEVHQPDNLETTVNGLYITEDPGSSQQFPQGSTSPNATNARIWQHNFNTNVLAPVLRADQSADEGPTDVDAAPTPGNMGAWELSGIVDVSSVYGPGSFLVDVQAHTLFTHTSPGPDLVAPAGPDWTNKREGGQLVLVTIPGG
jgi:serralysin